MLVPDAYVFKSVKWLTRIALYNLYHANDTNASGNNDFDTFMKAFSRSLMRPGRILPGTAIPVNGYSLVRLPGFSRVQTLVIPKETSYSAATSTKTLRPAHASLIQ